MSFGWLTETEQARLGNRTVRLDLFEFMLLDGQAYIAAHIWEAVVDDGAKDALIKVGAKPIFAFIIGAYESKGDLDIFEAPTTTDDGTSMGEVNLNRTSSNTPLTTTFFDPTVSDTGTELVDVFAPDNIVGFGDSLPGMWILKADTDYLVRTTNLSGQNADMGVNITFAEDY